MRPQVSTRNATFFLVILSFCPLATVLAYGMPPQEPKQRSAPILSIKTDSPNVEILNNKLPEPVSIPDEAPKAGSSRSLVLVASLTVFVLSIFVGFEIIAKVPPTLHTPLMSGSNAISGITVIGAIIAAGYKETGIGSLMGLVAVVLAMINVVGGFVVTHRMLLMFKKR